MSKKQARIQAVLSRKALSEEEKLKKISEILAEEEGDGDEEEAPPPEEGDEEETENVAEGDEEEADAEDEQTDPEAEDEEEKPAAKSAATQLKAARAIAASKQAKANPLFALSAITSGITFAAFKALAPTAGKGSNLASRMAEEPGARRLGTDAPTPEAKGGKVVKLKPAADYYAAAEGKKRSG